MRRYIVILLLSVMVLTSVCFLMTGGKNQEQDFIRYAEFNVTYPALKKALEADIGSQDKDIKISWIDLLAFLGAKYGGDFKKYNPSDMDKLIENISSGESIEAMTKDMKYYSYYHEVYTAVLGGFVGNHQEYSVDENGKINTKEVYGLKVFSPVAKGFAFSHYDDFGARRTYGFTREHLGHDMMCAVGTPIVAVEEGTVEAIGWNQYGGWRVGIRSLDKKRYYYYAHLRQNRPYHCSLEEGMTVHAGDVIGYAGRTGYSTTENVNNIDTPHLHWGLELIFDESQKECDNEIWVDVYQLTLLLNENTSTVNRDAATKEFYSISQELTKE